MKSHGPLLQGSIEEYNGGHVFKAVVIYTDCTHAGFS